MPSPIISGIFYRNGQKLKESLQEEIYPVALFNTAAFGMGACILGKDKLTGSVLHVQDNLAICGHVVLYNREELLEKLSLEDTQQSDAALVLLCYRQWDTATPALLNGAFSFAIWNDAEQELFCARDQMGLHPFFYHESDRLFVFSNSLKFLSGFSFAREIDEAKVMDLLQGTRFLKEPTIYKHISSLQPGHWMLVHGGNTKREQYWNIADTPTSTAAISLNDAVDGFKHLLDKAIEKRVPHTHHVGVELSGGLDSAAVTAVAQKYLYPGQTLYAFSNTLPAAYKNKFEKFDDEWAKATEVAKQVGLTEHKAVDGVDSPLLVADKLIEDIGYPTNFMLSYYQTGIYAAASKQDVRTLLSGFGGDEAVSMYAMQRYMSELMKKRHWSGLVSYYNALGQSIPKSIANVVRQWVTHMTMQKKQRDNSLMQQRWERLLLNDDILSDESNRQRYFNNGFFKRNSIKQHIHFFASSGGTQQRLETGYHIAALYDVGYVYPLLDIDLLQYFYAIPDKVKATAHIKDRGMLRRAMKNILPDAIVEQPKTDVVASATVPFARVQRAVYFEDVRQKLLGLARDSYIFELWDRNKLENIQMADNAIAIQRRYYDQLVSGYMLSVFIEKRRKINLHDV